MLESRIPTEWTGKLPLSESFRFSSWSSVMEGHAKKMCGAILWVGEQDDSTTLQSIYSMHRWPPLSRGRIEIRGRLVKSMLSNCSELLKVGTYWKTRYSMVSVQISTIDYEMDQSMWQTPESIDFIHSSHMWIQTVLVMWVILQNNAGWDCFKTPILQEILRTQNLLPVEHCVCFGKSYICSNKLDV